MKFNLHLLKTFYKNLCIDYTKKIMKLYQFERKDLKRINLLFNVVCPFESKYVLVSLGKTKTLNFDMWQLKGNDMFNHSGPLLAGSFFERSLHLRIPPQPNNHENTMQFLFCQNLTKLYCMNKKQQLSTTKILKWINKLHFQAIQD